MRVSGLKLNSALIIAVMAFNSACGPRGFKAHPDLHNGQAQPTVPTISPDILGKYAEEDKVVSRGEGKLKVVVGEMFLDEKTSVISFNADTSTQNSVKVEGDATVGSKKFKVSLFGEVDEKTGVAKLFSLAKEKDPVVRGHAVCLEVDDKGKFDCSKFYVNIYAQFAGQDFAYLYQNEGPKDANTAAGAAAGPSDDIGPVNPGAEHAEVEAEAAAGPSGAGAQPQDETATDTQHPEEEHAENEQPAAPGLWELPEGIEALMKEETPEQWLKEPPKAATAPAPAQGQKPTTPPTAARPGGAQPARPTAQQPPKPGTQAARPTTQQQPKPGAQVARPGTAQPPKPTASQPTRPATVTPPKPGAQPAKPAVPPRAGTATGRPGAQPARPAAPAQPARPAARPAAPTQPARPVARPQAPQPQPSAPITQVVPKPGSQITQKPAAPAQQGRAGSRPVAPTTPGLTAQPGRAGSRGQQQAQTPAAQAPTVAKPTIAQRIRDFFTPGTPAAQTPAPAPAAPIAPNAAAPTVQAPPPAAPSAQAPVVRPPAITPPQAAAGAEAEDEVEAEEIVVTGRRQPSPSDESVPDLLAPFSRAPSEQAFYCQFFSPIKSYRCTDVPKLINGTALDKSSPYYKVQGTDGRYYGTQLMIDFLTRIGKRLNKAIKDYRIGILDVTDRDGGPLLATGRNYTGGRWGRLDHSSHMNGLDADIRYVLKNHNLVGYDGAGIVGRRGLLRDKIYVDHQWELWKAAVKTGYVSQIFVNHTVKRAFCSIAREKKEYSTAKETLHRLRSEDGHKSHWHLRLRCPDGALRCRNEPAPGRHGRDGTGC